MKTKLLKKNKISNEKLETLLNISLAEIKNKTLDYAAERKIWFQNNYIKDLKNCDFIIFYNVNQKNISEFEKNLKLLKLNWIIISNQLEKQIEKEMKSAKNILIKNEIANFLLIWYRDWAYKYKDFWIYLNLTKKFSKFNKISKPNLKIKKSFEIIIKSWYFEILQNNVPIFAWVNIFLLNIIWKL